MHQVGKHWIELGVLALLGVLAMPLACGGVSEGNLTPTGSAGTSGATSTNYGDGQAPPYMGGIAGFGDGNANPCVRCQDMGGTGCPPYCSGDFGDGGLYFPAGGGGSGNIIGVDDGSEFLSGGAIGYDDGAPNEGGYGGVPNAHAQGGHAGNSGSSAIGGGPQGDGAPYFMDGH